jgi:hypothetical protein
LGREEIMKLIGTAIALLGMTAQAHAVERVWFGDIVLTTASAACAGGGVAIGNTFSSTYRPRMAGNGTDSHLTFMFRTGGMSAKVVGSQIVGRQRYEATVILVNGLARTHSAFFNAMASTPATITGSTQRFTIKGSVQNLFGIVGCNTNFRGVYVKRS